MTVTSVTSTTVEILKSSETFYLQTTTLHYGMPTKCEMIVSLGTVYAGFRKVLT